MWLTDALGLGTLGAAQQQAGPAMCLLRVRRGLSALGPNLEEGQAFGKLWVISPETLGCREPCAVVGGPVPAHKTTLARGGCVCIQECTDE